MIYLAEMSNDISNYSALGILGFIVVFTLTKGIPMIVEMNRDHSKAIVVHTLAIGKLTEAVDTLGRDIRDHDSRMTTAHQGEVAEVLRLKLRLAKAGVIDINPDKLPHT
jgi:hypothetical protein